MSVRTKIEGDHRDPDDDPDVGLRLDERLSGSEPHAADDDDERRRPGGEEARRGA